MSKSLKNFISIRESLSSEYTSRGLRIVFMMGVWKDPMEITAGMRAEGAAWEEKLNNFFIKAKEFASGSSPSEGVISHHDLNKALQEAQEETHKALCDSIDTNAVLRIISELITEHNVAGLSQTTASATLSSAKWVTSIVTMLGLNGNASMEDNTIGWSGIEIPADAMPILTLLSNKRDALRRKAIAKDITKEDLTPVNRPEKDLTEEQRKTEVPFKTVLDRFNRDLGLSRDSQTLASEILKLSDRIRDVDLFDLNVYLEDRDGDQPALIRPVTRDLREMKEAKEEKARLKQVAMEARSRKSEAKIDSIPQDPRLIFRSLEGYSDWDEKGIPTKTTDGEPIAKNKKKKFEKEWAKTKIEYDKRKDGAETR